MKYSLNIISNFFEVIFNRPGIRFSFLAVLIIIAVSTFFLSLNMIGRTYSYNIGDIAREDIRVLKDFHYVKEKETEMEKKRIAESIPLVFDKDASVLNEKLNIIAMLMNNVRDTLKHYPPTGSDYTFQVYAMKSVMPKYLHYSDAVLSELLRYGNSQKLKKLIARILIHIYDNDDMGVVDRDYTSPLGQKEYSVTVRTINSPGGSDEKSRSKASLKTFAFINQNLYRICYSLVPELPKNTLGAIVTIVRRNLQSNITFNAEETRRRIQEATKKVKPQMGLLKKGQTLVREGDTITSGIKKKIEIYNRQTSSSHLSYIFGILLVQFTFLLIFTYFIFEFNRFIESDKKSTAIIFTIIIVFLVYAFLLSRTEIFVNSKMIFVLLLPLPFATMIISILYNTYLAMITGVYLVFFTMMIAGGDISVVFLAFSTATLGVFVNDKVERRTDFLTGGFIIGFVNSLIIIAVVLMQELPVMSGIKILHIAFAGGIINSILVLGLLPLYENIFGITTKFKLLELSDLNADIFKRMLVEAPGTYNHSLIVSTMAEAACKEIGANHLLARVGSFYHDIGKIEDANMYIENRVTDPRAQAINSLEYSQLIISHVEKGVRIAEESGLPESVINFIREHHGTSVMTFFYHQALEEADSADADKGIKKSDFQYPGPSPHSRETAIVMIADAVEAASRSLQSPSYEKLEGLVRKIIYNKLNEGELEYSDLSMSDLNIIQETFLSILSGIFHTRIEYPNSYDIKKLENRVHPKK